MKYYYSKGDGEKVFKKSALAIAALLLCGSMICAAQPVVPVGLVDSTPANGILVNYNDWYAANAKPNDPKISGQTIFTSPRAVVMVRDGGIGTLAKNHFHSATDEIVIVMGGSGEILINDVWTPVKSGDIHINPRGNIHATRVNGSQDLKFISIFTPVTPTGGDANFLE
jgi:quercetin dioxygenase-like cupin family protein